MEVMIFGAGYVGLVTGAGLASTGNHVVLVDTLQDRIEKLRQGICPIYEPHLSDLLQESVRRGNLQFLHIDSSDFADARSNAEIYFVAVGTPGDESGRTQMKYVLSCVEAIAKESGDLSDKIVVMKSTVPVGTGDLIESEFKKFGKKPQVISNPEFLKQGNAVQDFLKPERVIIGTEDESTREKMAFLYRPFMLKRERLVFMKRRSAELVKYACNSYLATRISFINELAQLCEKIHADVREIREGMITDSRIGDKFLFPGIGFGGSCFPKDIHSLIHQGEEVGMPMKLATAAQSINQKQREWAFEKLQKHFGKSLPEKTICFWGLSFKPNTDDLREAPAVTLIQKLAPLVREIRAYDPVATERASVEFKDLIGSKKLKLFPKSYEAAEGADAVVLVTEWQEFRTPNFKRLQTLMKDRVLVDGRNIYDTKIACQYGFTYYGVGIG